VLALQERSTLWLGAAAPDPESVSAATVVALLPNCRLADVAPLNCGVNVTLYEALCPAFKVIGSAIPPTANSAVLGLAALIVTLDPLAVTVPVFVALCPTMTLPKSMLPGFTDNCPGALPDPAKATDRVGFEASEVRVRFPLVVPLTAGVNVMLKVRLCPAAKVSGNDTPPNLNADEETAAWEMVTLALPLFVTLWY
jgi:hypothetical protein